MLTYDDVGFFVCVYIRTYIVVYDNNFVDTLPRVGCVCVRARVCVRDVRERDRERETERERQRESVCVYMCVCIHTY